MNIVEFNVFDEKILKTNRKPVLPLTPAVSRDLDMSVFKFNDYRYVLWV